MNSDRIFFRASLHEPNGDGQRILTFKASRPLAERMALHESAKQKWDWLIERFFEDGTGPTPEITIIEQWSSTHGHQVLIPELAIAPEDAEA